MTPTREQVDEATKYLSDQVATEHNHQPFARNCTAIVLADHARLRAENERIAATGGTSMTDIDPRVMKCAEPIAKFCETQSGYVMSIEQREILAAIIQRELCWAEMESVIRECRNDKLLAPSDESQQALDSLDAARETVE